MQTTAERKRRKGMSYADHVAVAKVYRQTLSDLWGMYFFFQERFGKSHPISKATFSAVKSLECRPRSDLDNLEGMQAALDGVEYEFGVGRFLYYNSPVTAPEYDKGLNGEAWIERHIEGGAK